MSNVIFEPYVGEEYHCGYEGKKLLILGDSHYCDRKYVQMYVPTAESEKKEICQRLEECQQLEECQNITNNVLDRFLKYKNKMQQYEGGWMKTFSRFTNIFLNNNNLTFDEIDEFWNCVMFYNYVQVAMDHWGIKPEKHDFDNSQTAFFEVLKEYKPDLIIVWGKRLGENLPKKIRY